MNLCRLSLPAFCLLLTLQPFGAARAVASPQPQVSAGGSATASTISPSSPVARLNGAVRSTDRVTLVGSVSPQVRHATDLGPVPADYPLHGITLVLRRSPAQQADLDQLLTSQQDPASPEYHRWLTPDQFAARFGASESDLQAVEAWLTAQGFTLVARSHSRDRITFSGSAALVARAFGSPLRRLRIDGEPHIAPVADLTLPADLAAVTLAILHLDDLRPKPLFRPRPSYTTYPAGDHYLTPGDLNTMYSQNTTLTGLGHSIAVVGESYVDPQSSVLNAFRYFDTGFPAAPMTVLVPGTGVEAISPGGAAESDIDLEYTAGMAPNANVTLVYVGSDPNYGAFDALTFAIDQKIAEVVSVSYGECETLMSPNDIAAYETSFQQAAAQGQTLVVASGDSGSTACAPYSVPSQVSTVQQGALAVDFPADSPLVTAVGGTQMAAGTFTAGASPYWESSTGAFAGNIASSLLSYVPEVVWNEGAALGGIVAGGGGESTVFPQPAWQANFPGIPSGAGRQLPDIALQASVQSPGYLFCTDDPGYGTGEGQNPGCSSTASATGTLPAATGGGTSFAAPVFAAVISMLNEQEGAFGQGAINSSLYRLATSSPALFHDITAGSNACTAGTSTACTAPGQSEFPARSGFDEATGLGSLNFGQFLSAFAPAQPSTRQLTFAEFFPSSATLPVGTPEDVLITVACRLDNDPSPTPPSGTVSVSIDGSVVNPALPLATTDDGYQQSAVHATVSFPGSMTPGSHLLSLTYPGDSTHTPAAAVSSILVGDVLATGSVALAATNLTLAANSAGTSTVSISPVGGYNGRLFWSLALTASSNDSSLSGCYSIPTVPVDGPTSITLSLGLGTACNSPLPAARRDDHTAPARRAIPALHAPAPTRASSAHTVAAAAAAALLLCLFPLTRRRPLPILALLLLTVTAATLTGCGGGSSTTSPTPAPTPTPTPTPAPSAVTYTLTLTGTDSVNGAIQSTTTFTLTTP